MPDRTEPPVTQGMVWIIFNINIFRIRMSYTYLDPAVVTHISFQITIFRVMSIICIKKKYLFSVKPGIVSVSTIYPPETAVRIGFICPCLYITRSYRLLFGRSKSVIPVRKLSVIESIRIKTTLYFAFFPKIRPFVQAPPVSGGVSARWRGRASAGSGRSRDVPSAWRRRGRAWKKRSTPRSSGWGRRRQSRGRCC